MRHFGTFLNPQVASTVGYWQLYDKYATNAREEKENFEKVSSYYPAWGACVRASVSKIIPAPDWMACGNRLDFSQSPSLLVSGSAREE